MAKVTIAGVEVQKYSASTVPDDLKHHIPKVIDSYQFQTFVRSVLHKMFVKKQPVMLIGHTGCGKTSLPQQIAARTGQPVIRSNFNGQSTVSSFLGTWVVKNGSMEWVDGDLTRAMRIGALIILDEIDFGLPELMACLNGVLERDGVLTLSEKGGEVVVPHENFRIFATANTAGQMSEYRGLYQGANVLNEAFLDRYACYLVDYLKPEGEVKAVLGVCTMPQSLVENLVTVANMVREAFTNETVECTFSTRRLFDWAEEIKFLGAALNRQSKAGTITKAEYAEAMKESPFIAAEATIFAKISREDEEVIRGIIQRVIIDTQIA